MSETAPMPPADLPALDAAVARLGDRWTLLVVAALLDGPRRFGELQADLPGVAPNILTKRLRALETEGVVVAEPYSRKPLRVAYRLTGSGSALADVLRLLGHWGAAHAAPAVSGSERPEELRHASCGTPVEVRWWCPTCAVTVEEPEEPELDWL